MIRNLQKRLHIGKYEANGVEGMEMKMRFLHIPFHLIPPFDLYKSFIYSKRTLNQKCRGSKS